MIAKTTRVRARAATSTLAIVLSIALVAPAAAVAVQRPDSRSTTQYSYHAHRAALRKKRAAAAARRAAQRRAAQRAATRRAAARRAAAHRGRITRTRVLERGREWVRRNVPYSQSRRVGGYRTDCSGFVSMAWDTKTSYTTRSITAVSRRIGRRSLRAGDAVLRPGHLVLFVRWKDKRAGTFVAYEQANSAKDCIQSIQRLGSSSKALRYKRIRG